MPSSWLRQLFKKKFIGQGVISPVRRGLRVELLEDRTVPATVFWTGGAVADRDFNGDGDSTDIGETGSLLWSTAGNWSTGAVPGINDDVVFNNFTPPESANYNAYFADTDNRNAGLTGTVPHSIMDLTTTIKSLTIRGPGPTTGGNVGWFISRGRVVQDPIRDPDFPGGVFVPTTPGQLTILGNFDFDGAGTATTNFDVRFVSTLQNINVTTFGANLFINGDIDKGIGVTPPVGILKLGPGTVVLGGTNTFDGLVQVDAGVMIVTDNDALGTAAVGTVVANGATLTVLATVPESIQIQGSGVTNTGAPTGTAIGALNGSGTVNGGVVLNSSATVSGLTLFNGVVSNGSLTINGVISGAGDLTSIGSILLSNANTYNGATFIRDNPFFGNGSVTITNDDALSPGSFTEVFSGASLILSSSGGTGIRLVDDEVLYLNGLGNFNTTLQNFTGALTSSGTIATRTTPAEWRSRIFLATNSSIGTVELSTLLVSGPVSNLPIPAATLGALTPAELDAVQAYNALNRTTTPRASLTKLGKGTTIYPNANPDFAGNVVVTNGTLVMRNATALGPATGGSGGSITVDSDISTLQFGTLEVQGQYTVEKNLTINGNGFGSVGALLISDNPADGGATAITWAAPVALTTAALTSNTSATISTDAGQALTITGVVSGPTARNLQKNGTGSLTLTAANTFLGSVTVRAGTLAITNSTGLGAVGGAGTTISSWATLSLSSGLTIVNETLTLSSELGVAATLLVDSGTNLWTGVVNLVGNSSGVGVDEIIINTSAASGSIEFSNVISGDSKLRKLGAGTMRFSGTASNTFRPTLVTDPALSLEAGTVVFAKTLGPNGTTVNAIAGPIIIGDGAGGDSVDVLRLEQPNQIPDTVAISVLSSGLLDLNGVNETIAGPTLTGGEIRTGAGTLTLAGNVTTLASTDVAKISGKLSLGGVARVFDVANGGADPDLQVDAVISNAPGVTKAGAGTLQLGGANTYTGPTTVNAGVLRLGASNVLPDGTTVALAGGTTLDLNGQTDAIAALTGGATTTLAIGAGALIIGGDNSSSAFSGIITGAAAGGLAKVGTGTLTLNGPTSLGYAGTTIIIGGTVFVNTDLRNAPVEVRPGGTLGGTGTVGSVTVTSGGTLSPGLSPALLNINGDLTFYSSTFIVEANTTTIGSGYDSVAVTGAVTLNNTATLSFRPSFSPNVGDTFTILTATGGVTGTFSGLADGATFTIGTRTYQIHYTANSVTVSVFALASTATIQSSTNPSLPGQSVTFTVTIAPVAPGDAVPTGMVQFFDNGVALGAPVAVSATGTLNQAAASISTAALTNGSHVITASFTSTSGYEDVAQADLGLVQAVTVASTVTLQALNGPSVFGDTVGFVARVTRQAGLPVPTGTVTFVNSSTGEVLGTVALDANGAAALNTSTLRAGTSIISAVYSGDSFYRSGSGTATQIVDRQSRLVVGSDAGPVATVQVFDPRTGALLRVLTPFDGYTLGVKVATGDVNNDGISDIIVSAGAGAPGGHVRVFSGADYSEMASFFTFVGYTGGVNVAAGDVNGDGFADIIVGTAIANDHVKAFSGRNPVDTLLSFFAYSTSGGNPVGVTVGAGDVNGDGLADVITGSATFAGHVKAFSGQNNGQILGSYFAYGAGYLGGIYVAAGDLNGDGRDEIITGATNAPHVKALDALTGAELQSFIAYPGATFGVRVGAIDRDGDRLADILTGAGGSSPHVKVFDGQTLDLLDSFLAVPVGTTPAPGIFVGGSAK